jgi:excinuclease UvrABC ATPase subunit
MKKKIYVPAVFVILFGLMIFTGSKGLTDDPSSPYFKYVGIKSCATVCHKGDTKGRQLEIWQDSKHSQAFTNLQTPEADQIAKDKGFSTPAAETPLCIKCHVLGKDIDPEELDETFDKTQGVQCETCHGPGSEYKKLSLMKDKQQALANGLIMHDNGAEFCKTCHNSDSPTFKSFDYDESWAKIKHTDPNLIK